MMSASTASSSPFWTRRLCMLRNSCVSVLGSLAVILVVTVATIMLAIQSHTRNGKTLESRQFQLGGILVGDSLKVLRVDQSQSSPSSASSSTIRISEVAFLDATASASSALAPTASELGAIMHDVTHDEANMEDSHTTMAGNELLSALVEALPPIMESNHDASHEETELALSLLDSMSVLVINVAIVSISLAARLTDATLAALPVDAMAISSLISTVAGQTSTSVESTIPLILPAVAMLFGRRIDIPTRQTVNTSAQNLTGTYETIVTKGSYVINQIVATSFLTDTPLMEGVLSQVVDIVHVSSTKLNQTMCTLELGGRKMPWQVVLPCASMDLKSAASATALTLNPAASGLGASKAQSPEMAGFFAVPVESTEPHTLLDAYMKQPPSYADSFSSTTGPSLYAPMTSSGPPATSCETESSTTSSPAMSLGSPTCQTSALPPSPKPPLEEGPCSKGGYQCEECLNGWFCPPQETPPQAVPCGLGWPCYHCANGYFCSSTSSQSTGCSTVSSTSCSASTATVAPETEVATSRLLPRPYREADTAATSPPPECAQPSTTAPTLPQSPDAASYTSCCRSGNRDTETSQMTYQGPVAQLLAEARKSW
ncbi:hypothetical protein E4U41_000538 [Claviceps citrina]|nr:hypothetical protein E4U41_000538 [Claviceps citrina]